MNSQFLVFFQAKNSSYEKAIQLLNSYSFKVEAQEDKLIVRYDHFTFEVIINKAPYVLEEAQEIGASSPYQEAMNLCNARFEVSIEDLDAALDEINTLMSLQGALQDASKGYLFLPWNGSLSEPYLD